MTSIRIEHAPAIVIVVADVLRVAVVVALLGKGVLVLLLILLSRFAFTAHEIHFFYKGQVCKKPSLKLSKNLRIKLEHSQPVIISEYGQR